MSEDKTRWQKYLDKKKNEVQPWDILNPNIKKSNKEIIEFRKNLCIKCPEFFSLTKQCKKCGCFMELKIKLDDATCPIGKW